MYNVVHLNDWIRKAVWKENLELGHPLHYACVIDEMLEKGRIKAYRTEHGEWAFYRPVQSDYQREMEEYIS